MKPVLVVEGKSDANRIRNYIDCEFVLTNGSEVSRETLEYIKELSTTRIIIILTDPDYPGLRIRALVAQYAPNAIHAYVDRAKSIKGKKLGVCECEETELKRALEVAVLQIDNKEEVSDLTLSDLIEFGLMGQERSAFLRQKLETIYPVGKTNAKTLLKKLRMLGVSKNSLKKSLEEIDDSK